MKNLTAYWFTGNHNIGIVTGEDDRTDVRKAYIGVVPGFNEEADIKLIASTGSPVDPRQIIQIAGYLKHQPIIKCSFCDLKTQRTPDDKLTEGWGLAKGTVLGRSFDIVFCPNHRSQAEAKLDLIFKK